MNKNHFTSIIDRSPSDFQPQIDELSYSYESNATSSNSAHDWSTVENIRDTQQESHEYTAAEQSAPHAEVIASLTRAEKLADRAYETSDFTGMEVKRAIESYYRDHEVALSAVKVCMSEPTESERQSLYDDIDSLDMIPALKEGLLMALSQPAQDTVKLRGVLLDAVYNETCIGRLTLDEAEAERIIQTKAMLRHKLYIEEYKYERYSLSDCEFNERIRMKSSGEASRNEVRPAGRLLFHNSSYGMDVWQAGALQGRSEQAVRNEGHYNTQTSEMEGHSEAVHWSEVYDPVDYKSGTRGNRRNHEEGSMLHATFAVPWILMIGSGGKYSRGLEYAVVEAKAERKVQPGIEILESHQDDLVGAIGAGSPADQGADRLQVDTVYWASESSKDAALGLSVPVRNNSESSVMYYNPRTRREEAATYIIQSNNDVERGGRHYDAYDFGTGYGYPTQIMIQETPDKFPGMASKDKLRDAAPAIYTMQHESEERFAGQYAVPLRASEEEFMFRHDNAVVHLPYEKLRRETAYLRAR